MFMIRPTTPDTYAHIPIKKVLKTNENISKLLLLVFSLFSHLLEAKIKKNQKTCKEKTLSIASLLVQIANVCMSAEMIYGTDEIRRKRVMNIRLT